MRKLRDQGKAGGINDLDILQWKKGLELREQERQKIIDEALEKMAYTEHFHIEDRVLGTKYNVSAVHVSLPMINAGQTIRDFYDEA